MILFAVLSGPGVQMRGQGPRSTLHGRFREVRFSRDGKYVLAQDDSGIAVLTATPLRVLFLIEAQSADPAQFTPDSRQVVFVSESIHRGLHQLVVRDGLRLERWAIADGTRVEYTRIPARACGTQELSPDGRALACVDQDGTLRLVDVSSGQTAYEKKNFGRPFVDQNAPFLREYGDVSEATTQFSPDGRFLVAWPRTLGSTVSWDLLQRREVPLAGALARLRSTFVFIAPDRVLISRSFNKGKTFRAKLVAFPSGEVVSTPKVPPGPLLHAADPRFVLIRPFGQVDYYDPKPGRSAAVEFRTGQVIITNSYTLDAFGTYYVAERPNGELGLYERGKGLQASVNLRLGVP
jgi:WD40 repeat protein